MLNNKLARLVSLVLAVMLMLPAGFAGASGASGTDISGHWAEQDILKWYKKGLVAGYGDGSFKPNQAITRAEFIVLLNRVFNNTSAEETDYVDLKKNHPYYAELQKAIAAGYVKGYGDGTIRPDQAVTRQEAAVILTNAYQLEPSAEAVQHLSDVESLADWSKNAVRALIHQGFVSGYPDRTFKADNTITRAEAIRIMNNISGEILNQPGTYEGLSAKNVVINREGVVLKDATVEGDLYLTAGIGEGDVTLENVVVKGKVRAAGGGENSIHIVDSTIAELIVDKKDGKIRIVVSGSTSVQRVFVLSGAKLESTADGTAFENVVLDESMAEDAVVAFSGHFGHVEVRSLTEPEVKLLKGIIHKLLANQKISLHVEEAAAVKDLLANAEMTVTGKGNVTVNPDSKEKPVFAEQPAASSPSPSTPTTPAGPQAPTFTDVSVHDPSIEKDPKSGLYYVFGSHIEAAKSADLMNWTSFTNGYAAANNKIFGDLSANLAESFAWAGEDDADSKGGFAVWAPDVLWNKDYVNEDGTKGAYLMYYSVSSTYIRSAIGLAVSPNIEGPYKYVDTLIYSGFTKDEAYDSNSDVNKIWTNTHIDELISAGANPGWFTDAGGYNNDVYPNAIDPTVFHDKEGNQWLVYGSWSGGLFVYEVDEATGKPIYPGQDGMTEDGRIIDRYFGTKIAGGFHQSGEGPYIVYDKDTDYYYLYETYGGLTSTGGYNMRTFRSENPDGPYVDAEGKSPVFPNEGTSNVTYGNKLMSNYLFKRELGDPGSGNGVGYVSPGHNSVLYDDSGKLFNIFHTRFPNEGELHEVRVHQMFMNKDGWPVAAPYRYTGETLSKVHVSELVGEYKLIKHEQDNAAAIRESLFIRLNEDLTISGDVTGTWEKSGDSYAGITIYGETYNGVFVRQWDPTSARYTMTFTAMSTEGASVWGSKLLDRTDLEIVTDVLNDPALQWGNVVSSLTLPVQGTRHSRIAWQTSNPDVITDTGTVTRPETGEPVSVVLTATVTKGDISRSKDITVTVLPSKSAELQAKFEFEDSLSDSEGNYADGTITGNRINNTGGTITYASGKYGKAAEFDGASGVRLPDGLISNTSEYSVSLWLKPDALTNFTAAFFGGRDTDNWVSIQPQGPAGSTMAWFHSDAYYDAPSGMTIKPGEWSHVALTVEYGLVKLYVNGELRFTGTNYPNTFAAASDALFALGVNWWDTPYDGLIDDLRIYDGILSAQQVTDMVVDPNKLVESIQIGYNDKKLSIGNTLAPPAVSVYPVDAANRAIAWSSADESVAMVDPVTGLVTGIGAGTTMITATALDASGVTASYTLQVADGPVAYYKFDGDLNNSTALFGAGIATGTRIDNTGGAITYTDGVNGQAAVLDGASGIRLPDGLISTNNYTVSMALYLDVASQYTPSFFGARSADSWISFTPRGAVGNQTMLWSGTAWYDGTTGTQINTKEWVHIAFTVNNGVLKIYMNGVEKHSGTAFPNVFTTEDGAFAFGVNYWDTPFKGKVDELQIYDKALTAEQVQALVDITP
ncbi:hypothetical protein D3P08_02695 [Paenibacillus nanensis]|uniref:SLH domain-containing protein n=1 Tax=Paenibacillus nanensis TaxID=393251 RepID=A0A3A1VJJ2_9BACL|nr:LamG-like jellyroll fold domain-containing protein [Paenibacillus nanensis]RIX60484.1 hypothetical protein D3P08_02695 [Paenibacillus nanensis]